MPIQELPDVAPTGIQELPDNPPVLFTPRTRREGWRLPLQAEMEDLRHADVLAKAGSAVLPGIEQVTQGLANPIGILPNLAHSVGQSIGLVPPEQPAPFQPNTPIFGRAEPFNQGDQAPVGYQQLAADLFNTLTTGEMISSLPAFAGGGIVPQAAKAAFALPMAAHLPGQVANAYDTLNNPDATAREQVVSVGEPTIAGAMIGGLSMLPKTPTSGIKPQDFPFQGRLNLRGEEITGDRGPIPQIGELPPQDVIMPPELAARVKAMAEQRTPIIEPASQAVGSERIENSVSPQRVDETLAPGGEVSFKGEPIPTANAGGAEAVGGAVQPQQFKQLISDVRASKDRLFLEETLAKLDADPNINAIGSGAAVARKAVLSRLTKIGVEADIAPELKQPPAQSGPFTPEQLDSLLARGSEWLRANPEIYAKVKAQLRQQETENSQGGIGFNTPDVKPTTGQPKGPVELPLPPDQPLPESPPKARTSFENVTDAIKQNKPITVFHGTNTKLSGSFESFSHFTTDNKYAAMHGKVKEVQVQPKNPLIVDHSLDDNLSDIFPTTWDKVSNASKDELVAEIHRIYGNVDAIVSKETSGTTIIVLDPSIISETSPKARTGIQINLDKARERRGETGAIFPEGSEGILPEGEKKVPLAIRLEELRKKRGDSPEAEIAYQKMLLENKGNQQLLGVTPEIQAGIDALKAQRKPDQPVKNPGIPPLPEAFTKLFPLKELRDEVNSLHEWMREKTASLPPADIERLSSITDDATLFSELKRLGWSEAETQKMVRLSELNDMALDFKSGKTQSGLKPGRHLEDEDFGDEAGGGSVHTMVADAVKEIYGKGKDLAGRLKEWSKGAEDLPLSKFLLDPSQPLPDVPKNANEIFSQPYASEKMPILGRFMGGKAKIRTAQDRALAGWFGVFHGTAKAVAANVGEQIKGKFNNVFPVFTEGPRKGEVDVQKRTNDQSLQMADVFESLQKDPNSYNLSPEQYRVFMHELSPMLDRMKTIALKERIMDLLDEHGNFRSWFPRIITKHPEKMTGGMGPVQPLKFSTEREGVQRGYEFENDIEKRLVTATQRLYRAIANKRLADNPAVKPNSMDALRDQLKITFAEDVDSGAMTQAQIDRMAEGHEPIPLRGMFPPHIAKILHKEFASEHSKWRRGTVEVNSAIKASTLGFDVGAGTIQGQVLFTTRPDVWLRTQVEAFKAMVVPSKWSKYIQTPENATAANELAQLGISIGTPQEHLSGLTEGPIHRAFDKGGELARKGLDKAGAPKLAGKIAERAVASPATLARAYGRHFQTTLDVAKIELWKAWKPLTDAKELPKLARSIESILLTERLQPNMVSSNRALTEQAAFMAPAYYRGAINLVAGALVEKGVPGKQLRNSLYHYAVAGLALYYAVGKGIGMSNDELLKRADPRRADFLSWRFMQGDQAVNIGIGGVYRSFVRLLGNVYKTSAEHPGNWWSLSTDKNPLMRWYRGHAGPLPGIALTAPSGKDFLGRESDIADIAKTTLPLTAQSLLQRKEEGKVTKAELIGSQLGLITMPESRTDAKVRIQEDEAQKKYGKKLKELRPGERAKISAPVTERLDKIPSGMSKERTQILALQFAGERNKRLAKDLNVGDWLEKNKLELPGYSIRKTQNGKPLVLTEEEQEFLHHNMVVHYKYFLDRLQKNPKTTQDRLSDVMKLAHARAWRDTIKKVGKLGVEE